MRRPQGVALGEFGRVRITRDFDFDQIEDAPQQLRLGMRLPVLRPLAGETLDLGGEPIEGVAEFGMPEQPGESLENIKRRLAGFPGDNPGPIRRPFGAP
jgi:hypothetical protein